MWAAHLAFLQAPRGAVYYLAIVVGFFFLTLLVIHQLDDPKTGIYFMAGSSGLILL